MSEEPDRQPFPRPAPALHADAHKGDAGRVLCVVGSRTMPGAAVLVARAAQRAGAGLVQMGCLDESLLTIVPTGAPEAILLDLSAAVRLRGALGPEAAALLAGRDPHARLFGPGIGNDERARAVLDALLAAETGAPLVLDGDALNALDGHPERLRAAAAPLVLTPHPGEAGRLAGRPVPRDDAGRAEHARELARRSGAVVCLKGRGTVVTDGERVWVNGTGNPGMATAGAGDVLAGVLVAYLAAFRPADGAAYPRRALLDAAALAVHVHGLAGDLGAAELGRRALVASDLVRFLPAAQIACEGEAGGSAAR